MTDDHKRGRYDTHGRWSHGGERCSQKGLLPSVSSPSYYLRLRQVKITVSQARPNTNRRESEPNRETDVQYGTDCTLAGAYASQGFIEIMHGLRLPAFDQKRIIDQHSFMVFDTECTDMIAFEEETS